jgi:hypothetical protein
MSAVRSACSAERAGIAFTPTAPLVRTVCVDSPGRRARCLDPAFDPVYVWLRGPRSAAAGRAWPSAWRRPHCIVNSAAPENNGAEIGANVDDAGEDDSDKMDAESWVGLAGDFDANAIDLLEEVTFDDGTVVGKLLRKLRPALYVPDSDSGPFQPFDALEQRLARQISPVPSEPGDGDDAAPPSPAQTRLEDLLLVDRALIPPGRDKGAAAPGRAAPAGGGLLGPGVWSALGGLTQLLETGLQRRPTQLPRRLMEAPPVPSRQPPELAARAGAPAHAERRGRAGARASRAARHPGAAVRRRGGRGGRVRPARRRRRRGAPCAPIAAAERARAAAARGSRAVAGRGRWR